MQPLVKPVALLCLSVATLFVGCRISYSFTGSSIDYTVTKTFSVGAFPNQAPLVYPPLAQQFAESLKDAFIQKTKLRVVSEDGDMALEGEIIGYDVAPMAIKEDAYSSRTKLTLTVRVRYANKAQPEKNYEQSFSAYREFDSNLMLQDVQDALNEELVKEIVDRIFNTTAADW